MTPEQVGQKKFSKELDSYLREARRYKPLRADEERALAVRARGGDKKARELLVKHNLLFVVYAARRYVSVGLRLEDLVQEGNIGLLLAVEKFEPERGLRFTTYAIWWIRAYISKYLKQGRSIVRPRSGEVALTDLSLDATASDENDATHLELVEDEGPKPDEKLGDVELSRLVRKDLWRFRKRFGEIGWDIIYHRIAVDDPSMTLEEIGQRWGVSRERVRQLELRVTERLEQYLAA